MGSPDTPFATGVLLTVVSSHRSSLNKGSQAIRAFVTYSLIALVLPPPVVVGSLLLFSLATLEYGAATSASSLGTPLASMLKNHKKSVV